MRSKVEVSFNPLQFRFTGKWPTKYIVIEFPKIWIVAVDLTKQLPELAKLIGGTAQYAGDVPPAMTETLGGEISKEEFIQGHTESVLKTMEMAAKLYLWARLPDSRPENFETLLQQFVDVQADPETRNRPDLLESPPSS